MRQYLTATRYTLLELARNRLALGLLVLFVPIWFVLLGSVINDAPVPFRFRATGDFIQASGHDVILLSAGLNALTMIVGFLMFAATRKAAPFDRRLVLCGYTQRALILAKLTALVVAAALIALYTTGVLTGLLAAAESRAGLGWATSLPRWSTAAWVPSLASS